MPELPEVEVISNFLFDKIKNKKISNVTVNNWNLRVPITKNIDDLLKGKVINDIKRRGKYIILNIDASMAVIIHLGMSGKLIYAEDNQAQNKHDHVIFLFSDNTSVIFNDPRRFGLVIVLSREQELNFFNNLGIEPLTDEFNGNYLQKLLQSRKANIKSVLMNNKLIVGVGNIYASESLFRARISPLRLAQDLTYIECEKLAIEIKNTLSDAIAAGGSTLKDYAQPSGSAGYFQNNFYVYGKVQKPCRICNNIITLIRQNGRSTYFCNACQN
ncbi:bifunctional DNA-formamidopyrimidine glycosylase/DNA-(apurinic or apyrimidinic site) lyase [Wolbachia endosymbiont of Drosophila mauritiana]|uniref:bifunctional DNA-formamidopyrimidine glycosylase/DNA-(apurinic or apyrimidinic site) lyase n=1 Tax=unclassified Wolbachia TaxID=2640676 RepID=UPI00107ED3D2|nr:MULTISPECIES: bifunctional DNA-formamidopyrimidine glycosylase/DNA-(apurinic or apyrimidinic site) lyase [unclassified Wolbachia]QCB62208.1 bifunctional DNA-formamidopyrimidine glycosylase/DNA-(apurinic or apyrimidinic site) lyase [Wolbachia endosymbiont of Drosophila mauritiana]QCB63255.1 bifunctional DNA-formamidopyrimidine glycosylase/DNA-(apurinic or apyrimidinic site) lyase [Wolbachia endosymbiont of Drosophila mauritiana]QWE33485.1 Formamidopyrimidine-DNA glycosylase [Wolbachia endosymb